MSVTATIAIETDGGGQIVRLPEAFRLKGSEVQVSWCGDSLLLAPTTPRMSREQIKAILDELDRYKHIPFMEHGREQPPMPDDDDLPPFD